MRGTPTEYGADFVQERDEACYECRSCGTRRYGVIEGNMLRLELGE